MQQLIKAMHRDENGFTLVELMVVVVIIGILVAIGIPIYGNVTLSAAQRAHDANLRIIDGAIMQYFAEEGSYPDQLDSLSNLLDLDSLEIPQRLLDMEEYDWENYSIEGGGTSEANAQPVGDWGGYRSD